ncbi:MAG TPA: helix-turn-helix domain-containing protein [Thermoanaerobaculia bacterium]|nr:helix-turn-helix domain-containing protein [Thermoanaerobaculia bacterium]
MPEGGSLHASGFAAQDFFAELLTYAALFLIMSVLFKRDVKYTPLFIQSDEEAKGTMADTESSGSEGRLYTLSEISQRTGISMPTLQRYKKLYQDRLPSVGAGRKQRYPESALPVFDEIKNENAGKRGRPRKDGSAPRPSAATAATGSKRRGRKPAAAAAKPAGKRAASGRKTASRRAAAAAPAPAPAPARRGRKPAAAAAAPARGRGGRASGSGNLMTLTQISEQTGISYPTLVRYVRLYSDRLPHEGKGRARRFYPEAVSVFRELRSESGRGGRKPSAAKAAKAAKATKGRGRGRGPGRPPGAAKAAGGEGGLSGIVHQRIKALEKSQENLEKRFKGFVQSLQKLFR